MGKRGRPRHPDVLTPREWEVLGLVREGMTNDAISERLGISLDGVKYHVSEILGKLDVENRSEAARWQPEAVRRPWWAIAPLWLLRPRWLSPPIAGALGLGVAAAVGVLVWALVATGGGGHGKPVPVALPPGDKLAYIGADRNLWLIEGDTPARKLTTGEDALSSSAPQWSPDGQRILFRRTLHCPGNARCPRTPVSLWTVDTQTGELREQSFDFQPSSFATTAAMWSPDGRRLAFLSQTGQEPGDALWLSGLGGDTGALVPPSFLASEFSWSPDGTQLAIARTLVVDPNADTPVAVAQLEEKNGVYVVDISGGEPRPLVVRADIQRALEAGEAREGIANGQGQLGVTGVDGLEWSPDGAYVSFRATVLSASAALSGEALFTMAIDGEAPVYHGMMLRSPSLIDWFPGGHRFVFTRGAGRAVYFNKQLALAEAGVPGATVIAADPERVPGVDGPGTTMSARSDAAPDVSPDGKRIVYQASESTPSEAGALTDKIEGPREGIWLADADGSNARQLTSDPDYLDFFPRWSADGALIVFVRLKEVPPEAGTPTPFAPQQEATVWIMRADGSGARPLVSGLQRIGSYYGLFEWQDAIAWWREG